MRGTPANVYVDGLNLYHCALAHTPHWWLDLQALASRLLAQRLRLHRIRYFTARMGSRQDSRARLRQQLYPRALETIPVLAIHEGHFLSYPAWMPLADPQPGDPSRVKVVRTEEKGSDANLAAWLTRDAAKRDCRAAFVITGDSDCTGVIRMVRREFNFPVHVVDPDGQPAGACGARRPATACSTGGCCHSASSRTNSAMRPGSSQSRTRGTDSQAAGTPAAPDLPVVCGSYTMAPACQRCPVGPPCRTWNGTYARFRRAASAARRDLSARA